MNHRYSYCKKEVYDQPEPNNTSSTPPSQLDSDERESEAEEIDDNEEPEGEEDGEEDFSGFDMSDIRVVRVGEEYDEEEEEVGRGEKKQMTEHPVELDTVEKEVLKTLGMEDMMDSKTEKEIGKPMENGVLNDTVENK